MLGRAIFARLSHSFECIGTAFSRVSGDLKKLDLRCSEDVKEFLSNWKPDIVVHSAAERRPDEVQKNPDGAYKLNVEVTDTLATVCAELKCFLLYISTDYVFDGDNAPYEVDALPCPINQYGELKLAGENVLMSKETLSWCILRVPVLYGETGDLDESAVTVLFNVLKKSVLTEKPTAMNHVERRYPTFCEDVAQFVHRICLKYHQQQKHLGILHYSGSDCLTKCFCCW